MAGLIERWILENIYCLNAHLDEFFTQLLITDLIFFLRFIGMLVDLDNLSFLYKQQEQTK